MSSTIVNKEAGEVYLWLFCRECGTVHKTTPSGKLRRICCRKCRLALDVPPVSDGTLPDSETPAELVVRNESDVTKVFWTQCPFCKKRYKLKSIMHKDIVQCNACDTLMRAIRVAPEPVVEEPSEEAPVPHIHPVGEPLRRSSGSRATATVVACSYCGAEFSPGEEKITCEACGLVFHAECWKENLGCTAYGCRMQNCLKAGPDFVITSGEMSQRTAPASAVSGDSFFVARNGKQEGPYPRHAIEAMLTGGSLSAGDLAWKDGMPSWCSLGTLFPPPPPAATPAAVAPATGQAEAVYMVSRNGHQEGPYRAGEITKMVAGGKLSPSDSCWTAGMASWQPISTTVAYCGGGHPAAQQAPVPRAAAIQIFARLALIFASIHCGALFLAFSEMSPLFSGLSGLAAIPGVVLCSLMHYHCWCALPERYRHTTPGKAIGYLFIPFYNMYWSFISWPKLVAGMELWASERHVRIDSAGGLALAFAILHVAAQFVTFMVSIPMLVVGILLYRNIINAVEQLEQH